MKNLEGITNREDWIQESEIADEDGGLVDLTDATITVEIRDPDTFETKLSATNDNGKITFPSSTVFKWWFTVEDMRTLNPGEYEIGCTVTTGGITSSVFTGTFPVTDGIVR